jgi:hypothetical protein
VPQRRSLCTIAPVRHAVLVMLLALVAGCSKGGPRLWERGPMVEMVCVFSHGGQHVEVPVGDVRRGMADAGVRDAYVEVAPWKIDDRWVPAIRVRAPDIEGTRKAQRDQVMAALEPRFTTVRWAGDRLFVRSNTPAATADVDAAFADAGLVMVAFHLDDLPDEGTGEYSAWFRVAGSEDVYRRAIEQRLGGIAVTVVDASLVGARR